MSSKAATARVRDIRVVPAAGPHDMDQVRTLFLEYQAWLGVDLCFQGFAEELKTLPGGYAPPRGGLWFARCETTEGEIAGVVGLRPMPEAGHCELKRLWVRPAFRGLGLGRRLAETAIDAARAAGYHALYLDTLPQMHEAQRLYAALGFRETKAYYNNPIAGVVYMELLLDRAGARSG